MHGLENSFGKEAGKLGKDSEWDVEGRFAFRALAELKVARKMGSSLQMFTGIVTSLGCFIINTSSLSYISDVTFHKGL